MTRRLFSEASPGRSPEPKRQAPQASARLKQSNQTRISSLVQLNSSLVGSIEPTKLNNVTKLAHATSPHDPEPQTLLRAQPSSLALPLLLPPPPMHKTDASSIADGPIQRSIIRAQFPSRLLLSCTTPTVEGEDRSFLRQRRTHMKLPLSTTSPYTVVAAIVRSFLLRYYYRPQLPPSSLLSFEASSTTATAYCHPQLPSPPPPSSKSSSATTTLSFPTYYY